MIKFLDDFLLGIVDFVFDKVISVIKEVVKKDIEGFLIKGLVLVYLFLIKNVKLVSYNIFGCVIVVILDFDLEKWCDVELLKSIKMCIVFGSLFF